MLLICWLILHGFAVWSLGCVLMFYFGMGMDYLASPPSLFARPIVKIGVISVKFWGLSVAVATGGGGGGGGGGAGG